MSAPDQTSSGDGERGGEMPHDPGRDRTPAPSREPVGDALMPQDHREEARARVATGEPDPVLEEAEAARAREEEAREADPDRPSLASAGQRTADPAGGDDPDAADDPGSGSGDD